MDMEMDIEFKADTWVEFDPIGGASLLAKNTRLKAAAIITISIGDELHFWILFELSFIAFNHLLCKSKSNKSS